MEPFEGLQDTQKAFSQKKQISYFSAGHIIIYQTKSSWKYRKYSNFVSYARFLFGKQPRYSSIPGLGPLISYRFYNFRSINHVLSFQWQTYGPVWVNMNLGKSTRSNQVEQWFSELQPTSDRWLWGISCKHWSILLMWCGVHSIWTQFNNLQPWWTGLESISTNMHYRYWNGSVFFRHMQKSKYLIDLII